MNTRDYQVFKLFGAKPIKINSEGLNLNGFKFSERIKLGNNFRIVFLGRIIEEKGIFDILKLADSFKSFKNVQIDIFGDLSETPLEFIKKAETLNNLKIFGFTRNPLNEIKNSDLIILPSKLNEGLPRIMLEAFSVGRICVSYNIPGCSDIYGFTDFKTDFLANSSQEFIQICKSVYFLSQENYSRIVKNLHCSVICNHDINTINNNLINQLKF
jgi:glycosyltransferase involved in cell wall biosynthesis